MKKIKYLITILALAAVSCPSVFAETGKLSINLNKVYAGDSFVTSIDLGLVAAWNVHLTASGPVEGCILGEADVTEDARNIEKSFDVNCKALSEGTISLALSGDYTDENGTTEDLSDSMHIIVTTRSDSNGNVSNEETNNEQNDGNEKEKENSGEQGKSYEEIKENDKEDKEHEEKKEKEKEKDSTSVSNTKNEDDGSSKKTGNFGALTSEHSMVIVSVVAAIVIATTICGVVFYRIKSKK